MASAQDTERPCPYTCESIAFTKFCRLTPSEIRSQAVVRSAEGEVISLPCCLLRTLCDCQMSGLPALALLALVNLLVMNSVFIVNGIFGTPQKKLGEGHFTTFHRIAYHV